MNTLSPKQEFSVAEKSTMTKLNIEDQTDTMLEERIILPDTSKRMEQESKEWNTAKQIAGEAIHGVSMEALAEHISAAKNLYNDALYNNRPAAPMVLPKALGQLDEWKTSMLLFQSAMKQVNTKIEILNNEFAMIHHYNPIEHVKSRIKSPESIVKKLKRLGYEVDIDNMLNYLNDIAGVRIICSFVPDIYRIADMISNMSDVHVYIIKDYIANPKPNGYRSYHMVVSVPVFLSDGPVETKVEIQIRTVAMDFWASLEHKIYYKYDREAPESMRDELKQCADIVKLLDDRMMALNDSLHEFEMEEDRNR